VPLSTDAVAHKLYVWREIKDFTVKAAVLGSAVVALGVATGSLLAPQDATALDFNFSWGGVEGLITGLVEGVNICAGPPCVVTVQVAGSSGAPTGPYAFAGGGGFAVTGGSVVTADWLGLQGRVWRVEFLNQGRGNFGWLNARFLGDDEVGAVSFTSAPSSSAVPGPLPLFGAAAAFVYSRKLRKRIKGRSNKHQLLSPVRLIRGLSDTWHLLATWAPFAISDRGPFLHASKHPADNRPIPLVFPLLGRQ
jgi:hypothetical protein